MADINQSSWSETDASNNSASPAGFPEGMPPSGVNDSARSIMGAVRRWYDRANATVTSGGSGNAQTLTYPVAGTAYVKGDAYCFTAGFTNTGATSINIDGLGLLSVVTTDGAALTGGEIQANQIYEVVYDGTNLRLQSQARQSIGSSGYLKLGSELIVQWGSVAFAGANTAAIGFPMNFPNAVYSVILSIDQAAGNTLSYGTASVTTAGFAFNLSTATTTTGRWLAVGI